MWGVDVAAVICNVSSCSQSVSQVECKQISNNLFRCSATLHLDQSYKWILLRDDSRLTIGLFLDL